MVDGNNSSSGIEKPWLLPWRIQCRCKENPRCFTCPRRALSFNAVPINIQSNIPLALGCISATTSVYLNNRGRISSERLHLYLAMASSLASSVSSLQLSLQLLDSSINILDSGVNDFPRLCKVLQTTRVSL